MLQLDASKNLTSQCVQGCGLVQVNVEIKTVINGLPRINITDVLKPADDDEEEEDVKPNIGMSHCSAELDVIIAVSCINYSLAVLGVNIDSVSLLTYGHKMLILEMYLKGPWLCHSILDRSTLHKWSKENAWVELHFSDSGPQGIQDSMC